MQLQIFHTKRGCGGVDKPRVDEHPAEYRRVELQVVHTLPYRRPVAMPRKSPRGRIQRLRSSTATPVLLAIAESPPGSGRRWGGRRGRCRVSASHPVAASTHYLSAVLLRFSRTCLTGYCAHLSDRLPSPCDAS